MRSDVLAGAGALLAGGHVAGFLAGAAAALRLLAASGDLLVGLVEQLVLRLASCLAGLPPRARGAQPGGCSAGVERERYAGTGWARNRPRLALRNPTYTYNPDLFWDADPSREKEHLPAGPNSPVGVVWIDLTKEHYGIHGTPVPELIGQTQSHGCVRLTNWDAARLAQMVRGGTKVVFQR